MEIMYSWDKNRKRKDKRYTYTNNGVVGVVGWASLSFRIVLIYRSLYIVDSFLQ